MELEGTSAMAAPVILGLRQPAPLRVRLAPDCAEGAAGTEAPRFGGRTQKPPTTAPRHDEGAMEELTAASALPGLGDELAGGFVAVRAPGFPLLPTGAAAMTPPRSILSSGPLARRCRARC